MTKYIFFIALLSLATSYKAQSKPYKDGTSSFGMFDTEYRRTTAECDVKISGNNISVRVTENLYGDIYRIGELFYQGRLAKVKGYWYIIEDESLSTSDPEFDYQTARIDFNRKLIIYN